MKEDGVDNHWEKFPHWNLLSNRETILFFNTRRYLFSFYYKRIVTTNWTITLSAIFQTLTFSS
jgi:hypothetical protein